MQKRPPVSLFSKMIFILMLSLSINGYSQQLSIKWVQLDQPATGGWHGFNGFVGKDETGAYYFEQDRHIELMKVDNNMTIVRKTLPPIGGIPNFYFYPRLFLLDGKLWLLANSRFEKGDKSYNIFAQEIDKNTLEYKGEMLTISKQVGEGKFKTPYELILSDGSDKYCYLIGGADDNQYFKVFNAKMEMVRDNLHFPFGFSPVVAYADADYFNTRAKGPITSIVTDNEANVFINYTAKGNHIYAFLKNSSQPIILNLDQDHDNTRSFTTLKLNTKQELICAGFYVNKETGIPQGVILAKIDPKTAAIISQRKIKLDNEIITGLPPAGKEAEIKFGSNAEHRYEIHHFITDEQSALYLSFEHHMVVDDEKGLTAQNRPPTRDDYREIFAVHLTENGDIIWQKTIPRWLRNENTDKNHPHSFFNTVKDGKYIAFYIDHPENISKNNVAEMKYVFPEINQLKIIDRESQFGAIVGAIIDQKGVLERKIVEQFKSPLTIHPLETLKLTDHQFLLLGYDCGQQANEHRFKKLGLLEIQ